MENIIIPDRVGCTAVTAMVPEVLKHIVLDLETLSLDTDAAIISIGAVGLTTEFQLCGYFYTPLRVRFLGSMIDTKTLNWWIHQSVEASAAVDLVNGLTATEAIQHFIRWASRGTIKTEEHAVQLWGNGPEFDNVIFKNFFERYDEAWPFAYNSAQSIRTIRFLNDTLNLNAVWQEPRIKHHALYDAEAEALFLQDVMKRIYAMDAQISDAYLERQIAEIRDSHTHHG